eukprot:381857-Pleurochrysis_carterae.AAC.1
MQRGAYVDILHLVPYPVLVPFESFAHLRFLHCTSLYRVFLFRSRLRITRSPTVARQQRSVGGRPSPCHPPHRSAAGERSRLRDRLDSVVADLADAAGGPASRHEKAEPRLPRQALLRSAGRGGLGRDAAGMGRVGCSAGRTQPAAACR